MEQKNSAKFEQVYPLDYEAAQDLIQRHPDVPEGMFRNIDYLAGLHARIGPREFKLVCGVLQPRHPLEAHFIDLWKGAPDSEELTARGDALDRYPVTLTLLTAFQEDLSEATIHYGQMLSWIRNERDRNESAPSDEMSIQTISYFARELTRRYSVTKYQLHAIHTLAEECRAEAGRPIPTHGQLSAPSAMQLARECHDLAADHWFRLLRPQKSGRLEPHLYGQALRRFRNSILPQLPRATWLQTIVSEEFALLRLFLRKHGPFPVDEAHEIYGTPNNAVVELEPQVAVEAARTSRQPSLPNWACAYDGMGHWYLFHKSDGQWGKPGRIEFPAGLPSEIMKLFAEHGGRLDRAAAIAWLEQQQPRHSLERRSRSLTENISRARTSIRDAVAAAGKFDSENIPDPLPLLNGSWIAAVEIGFAVTNDAGRLDFKRKEDM